MGSAARPDGPLRKPLAPLPRLVQLIVRRVFSQSALIFLAGAGLSAVVKRLFDLWLSVSKVHAESLWRRHVDFSTVQACVLSTEHLKSLGRVEKRTLFVKPIAEVFRNEYMRYRLIEAAQKAATSKDPVLLTKLSAEDKWHVLNTCTNSVSACFAPYHIFFNEARRVHSYYKSAWYCFTITCAQTEASGRWFITPMKPVGAEDVGSLRIRIVLMNEQELREIASGEVEAPPNMFNGRHESRWQVCQRFAELFNRQLTKVTGNSDCNQEEETAAGIDPRYEDWGKNLCGSLRKTKVASNVNLMHMNNMQAQTEAVPEYEPEDNSILRIHIPFPSTQTTRQYSDAEGGCGEEAVARDVVLFE